jgi:hypothetical protein
MDPREMALESSTARTTSPRSPLRGLFILCVQVLVFGGLFFGVAELGARWIWGFKPLTPAYFIFEYHPRWGWRHTPGAEGTFVKLGFQQPIQINSRGLREREIPYEKPAGVARVLAVGDSNVAGFEVPVDKVWVRVTESILRERGYNVEFINAGHRGYGTDQSLLFLTDEGMKYQPDLVLYFWSTNDIDDNITIHRPYRKYGKGYFDLDASGALTLKDVPIPDFELTEGIRVDDDGTLQRVEVPGYLRATLFLRDALTTRSAFATAMVYLVARMPEFTGKVMDASTFGDFRGLDETNADLDTRAFRVTSALVREMQRVAGEQGARVQIIGVRGEWPKALRKQAGMPELGIFTNFWRSVPDPVAIRTPYDPHWNELGNRLYAEALADGLMRSGFLDHAKSSGTPQGSSEP